MKKLVYPFLFWSITIFSLGLIDGCSSKSGISVCTASIPTSGSAGAPLTFASCALPSGSYSWSFGDGTAAVAGDTVTHTYASAGTYTGTVTVTGSGGSASKTFSITVINDSWTFQGSTFATDSVATTGITLSATGYAGANKATLNFVFYALPTASGSYAVVNAANNNVGPNQLYVIESHSSGNLPTIYGSTGSGTVNAAVTVSGGKISIALPATEMVNLSNPTDSASISASITQTQ
jgi:PKD repeat protein